MLASLFVFCKVPSTQRLKNLAYRLLLCCQIPFSIPASKVFQQANSLPHILAVVSLHGIADPRGTKRSYQAQCVQTS